MQKEILISIQNIRKSYYDKNSKKTIIALKNVTFDIYKGEILSLLGVNGAGKTTLSSIISTLHPPTQGTILYEGNSIYNNLYEYRENIGFCPQIPNIDAMLTIRQNLFFAGKYFNIPFQQIEKRANELMRDFDLYKYADARGNILSGGYKQRFLLARTLMHNPKLVILDEPTVGLDPHIRRNLWVIIKELKNRGVTVVLTTHYLDEAEFLSDRVCILNKGAVFQVNSPENLKKMYSKKNLEDVFIQFLQENPEERYDEL